jgi:fructose-1,6-bisphosphatase II
LQVIALAERSALFDPGPCMYMHKLAVGPEVDPASVSLDASVKENLEAVSLALGKPIGCAHTHIVRGAESIVSARSV